MASLTARRVPKTQSLATLAGFNQRRELAKSLPEKAQLARDMLALSKVARTALRDRATTVKALVAYATVAREAGGLLLEVPRTRGVAAHRGKKGNSATESPFERARREAALAEDTAHRWQQLAKVDRETFETWGERALAGEIEPAVWALLGSARMRTPAPGQPTAPPEGRYRCLVIDPPWPMEKIEREQRPGQGATLAYPLMTPEQLADEHWLPVRGSLAEDGAHVYLWVTHRFLPLGLELMKEWGVDYQCVMTWVKNVGITPFSWMYDTEHVLFGTAGSLRLEALGLRLSFEAKAIGHSVKPDVFYERVCAASPGPRLDMFARTAHEGFVAWGNETGGLARVG